MLAVIFVFVVVVFSFLLSTKIPYSPFLTYKNNTSISSSFCPLFFLFVLNVHKNRLRFITEGWGWGGGLPPKCSSTALRSAKASKTVTTRTNRYEGVGEPASAKQLTYSATCSFNSLWGTKLQRLCPQTIQLTS